MFEPYDITVEMNKIHVGMEFKVINDHLNRKPQEINQTDKLFTTPQKLLKSLNEPAIKQLLGSEKYLDNKITNKGSDVKVYAHKQNLMELIQLITCQL